MLCLNVTRGCGDHFPLTSLVLIRQGITNEGEGERYYPKYGGADSLYIYILFIGIKLTFCINSTRGRGGHEYKIYIVYWNSYAV
jgi:hypothetical protein